MSELAQPLLYLCLGALGGLVSGLLGLGGAVIMIPLMLAVPPLLGFPSLSMQTISGLSIVQVFFASLSGILVHRRNRLVDRDAFLVIGLTMAAATLGGVALSSVVTSRLLLVVFGLVAIVALVLMALPPSRGREKTEAPPLNRPLAAAAGLVVGLLSGMVGVGGGFVLIPIMISLLGMPVKTAVGTSLGIVLIGSVVGAGGKVLAGQVDWVLALPLVLGAVPAARLGATLSGRLSPSVLRIALIAVVLASCLQAWLKVLAG